MKGLDFVPGVSRLKEAYDRLFGAAGIIDTERLALYSQWARLDPRLAEILAGHLAKHWDEIPVGRLIESLSGQPWPRAIAVPLRFAAFTLKGSERRIVQHVIEAIESAFPAPAAQLFFIPLQVPSSVVLRGELGFRSTPYTQAGYIGAQPLLPHGRPPPEKTLLPSDQRRRLLKELLARQSSVTVSDFIRACKGMVSRRQAQRDLAAAKGASARGFTRRRIYRRK